MTRNILSAVIIVVVAVAALLFGQLSGLPPGKQAIEDQYAQERIAGNLNPALSDPNASAPIVSPGTREMGILEDCTPFPGQGVTTINCWQGIVNNVETTVYGGAQTEKFNPQQGLVVVEPKEGSIETRSTPVQAGGVRIVAEEGTLLTLVSALSHYVFTFDVKTRSFTSSLIDNTPPVINGMPSSNCRLWPLNHKMAQVAVIHASDALAGVDPNSFNVTATSNEVQANPREPDIVVTKNGADDYVVQLRSERLGTSTDRIYSLTVTVKDFVGNTIMEQATCTVPHDQGQ